MEIYTITVFQGINQYGIYGSRCCGYYLDFLDADDAVKTNSCDLHEYTYSYAVVEKTEAGVYPCNLERWFYKWSDEEKTFISISEPEELEHFVNFGIG